MDRYDTASSHAGAHHEYSGYAPGSPDDLLRGIGPSQKHTKDGREQKRRGPKPDSKPALTRRQELNRQAQRTHRQRKEQYTKTLEGEVLRLRELYSTCAREKDAAIAEAMRLRDVLKAHGIHVDLATPSTSYNATMPSYSGSNSGSVSGNYRQESNTTGLSPSPIHSQTRSPQQMQTGHAAQVPSNRLDHDQLDQLGIDFVLALERPCMEHMQYLAVRSHNVEGQPFHHPMERPDDMEYDHMSGHALMATCPTWSHIMDKPGEPYPHKMPDIPKSDLMKLLEASSRLPTEGGEVTPIKAWTLIMKHERCYQMTKRDFEMVQAELLTKVRCYGFGAVLEDFEVSDAIEGVFAGRDSVPAVAGVGNQACDHQHGHHVMA